MRRATRKENGRWMFGIVMVLGCLQFLNICYYTSDESSQSILVMMDNFNTNDLTITRTVRKVVSTTKEPNVSYQEPSVLMLKHKELKVAKPSFTGRTSIGLDYYHNAEANLINRPEKHTIQLSVHHLNNSHFNGIQKPSASQNKSESKIYPNNNPKDSGTKVKKSQASVRGAMEIGARNLIPLLLEPSRHLPPVYKPELYGQTRRSRGFLTIGIPSVRRPSAETIYLLHTLQSLIGNTNITEQREVTLVVMLSDTNITYTTELCKLLTARFNKSLENGFIRIIQPSEKIYPNLDRIKRTFNDGKERLKWRAKQNIDFAYLFLYSSNISEFYIQIEDDVLSAKNFVSLIKAQIVHENRNKLRPWFMLEFAKLGFIGKLFRSADLPWVAKYLLQNYDSSPGDLMLGKILKLRGQQRPIHIKNSLFQHIGKFSSLQNKLMPSIDASFRDADSAALPMRSFKGSETPKATIITSFEAVDGYPAGNAYDGNNTSYFWSKYVKRGQYFQLVFMNPQTFSRIIITSGDEQRKLDSLPLSTLYVSIGRSFVMRHKQTCTCGAFKKMADFVDGEVDTKAMGIHVPPKITCLKIDVRKQSKTWVKLREIVLVR